MVCGSAAAQCGQALPDRSVGIYFSLRRGWASPRVREEGERR